MSRIGKKPIAVPQGVTATINGQEIKVKGPKGELSFKLVEELIAQMEKDGIHVAPRADVDDLRRARAMWGMSRTQIANMVQGVSKGFTQNLEVSGVGYKAAVQGKVLNLQLGFSHDINFPIPAGIDIKCEKPTLIAVSGFDRQRVGQVAAQIRGFREPEPYGGKGIKYAEETIRRKEGKKK
ncbi:MAG: 50S ribosomal protein L6 [Alphaproteobacteria bacterium]|nr:50S ribosomal protein L6 [Alphaproteobacteria bacterium]